MDETSSACNDKREGEETLNAMSGKHAGLVSAPKRKVALLFAYLGSGYHGLQVIRDEGNLKSIEGALFQALVNAKVVPENCLEDQKKMCYKSASRTDKGVSTCGQVASLKIRLAENVVTLINKHLPDDILVLDAIRTTQGFNAQMHAIARTYSYTLPTYAFADHAKDVPDNYRISSEKLKYISSIMCRYKGTHNFHNFTSGKKMGEMSAKRYIMDFFYEEPFLVEETEYMTCFIKGQSFMMHQIRKMMGLMIAMVSNHAKEDHFVRAFSEPLEDIPRAPGTGLVLQEIHYDAYNKKFAHLHGGIVFSHVAEKQKEFLRNRILPSIYRENAENGSMRSWLETLENHDYSGEKARLQWAEMEARKNSSSETPIPTSQESALTGQKHLPEEVKDEQENGKSVDDGEDVSQEPKSKVMKTASST